MKKNNNRLVYIVTLITLICLVFCSCSYLIPPLELPDFNEHAAPSESIPETIYPYIEPNTPPNIYTTDTESNYQSSVLVTDETSAVYIPDIESEWEATSESTSQHFESIDTDQGITEIPLVRNYYASDDGYNALSSFEHGSDMQLLYYRLANLAKEIHDSDDTDVYSLQNSNGESIDNIIGSVYYPSSLTQEELFVTFNLFKSDHPLFYWIDNQIIFSSRSVYLMTTDDYAYGVTRAQYNALIESEIKKHLNVVKNERSTYRKALYFHDSIILGMDYTESVGGFIPTDLKYHNIYGAFIGGSGVCESYAKAFQLLLNAAEIDNRYVIGVSGTTLASGIGHVWNMLQLDNGKWYYCDLTWDDLGDEGDGVQHNNFCVGENSNISWGDDGYIYTPAKFDSEHIENLPTGIGEDFLYELPVAEASAYHDGSDDMLRTIIDTEDFTYMITGYNEVTLLQIKQGGEIGPLGISYNGHYYVVSAIVDASLMCDTFGEIQNYTMFSNTNTTSLYIAQTVRFVSNAIFEGSHLPEIIVEENNPYIYYDNTSGTVKKK